jgi:hypothetical protein
MVRSRSIRPVRCATPGEDFAAKAAIARTFEFTLRLAH